jgi:hypothetical protein
VAPVSRKVIAVVPGVMSESQNVMTVAEKIIHYSMYSSEGGVSFSKGDIQSLQGDEVSSS